MKKLRFLLLTVLVVIFAFQSIACNDAQGQAYEAPHMNDRVYERIDEEAFNALVEKIYALVKEDGNSYELNQAREEFFSDYYNKAFTMNTLASINYDKDVTSEYWQEESVWALTFAQNVQNTALEVEKAIFGSEFYGEYFTRLYGEDYAESIFVSEVESEEQLALSAQIASLEADYNVLFSQGKYMDLYETYIQLVTLRNEYAHTKKDEEGNPYKNYMDYAYANVYSREYTPDEVSEFRDAVLTYFKPIQPTVEALYYDYNTDTEFLSSQIATTLPFIIRNSIPEMLSSWQYMMNKGLYDFEVSETKANTSYVTTFYEYNDAYMFVNTSGSFISDLPTLVHEFGHYNEKFMAKEELEDPRGVRSYDLAETHSQAFELITLPAVKKLVDEKFGIDNLYETYAVMLLDNSVWAVLSNCIFDEFEYAMYNAKPEELTVSYINSVFDTAWTKYWGGQSPYFFQVPHLFVSPAYCISYAVSLVFAAEIWASEEPVKNYLTAVEYGSYNYLSTVYTAMGLESPLAPETVEKVALAFTNYIDEYILL